MRNLKIIIAVLFFAAGLKAQLPVGRDTITVQEGGKVLKNAWAGGLNSCMFSQIELNFDGKLDLVVFDKVNNFGYGIFRCFINKGGTGQIDYVYDAWYSAKFPAVEQWALFYDYNNDSKMDLFTYVPGGIKVFKNTSTAGNISFQLAKPMLWSNYSPTTTATYVNIYSSSVSVPAFSDLDNDGDLDILTFSSSGFQIEHHKNMRIEKGYPADSLVYDMVDWTWGDIIESGCGVTLNQYKENPNGGNNDPNKVMHSGSALMAFDRDGDGDKDLLMGDISCNAVNYCENGGTVANSHITDTTKLYPNYPAKANTTIIKMNNFPGSYNLDIDNDGKKDLVVSPNTINSENFQSCWLYKNVSATAVSDFQFTKNNFLQDEMIDLGEGAYPVLFDVDADGLLDMVVGNTGYYISNTNVTKLAYYKNTGTLTQPSYSLITRDLAGLSVGVTSSTLTSLVPTFGDIDGDGDKDMIVADFYGKIHWSENTAGSGNPCNFSIFKNNFFGITTSQGAPYPQLIDVDRDGRLDLIIGLRNGKLAYYQNNGTTTAPSFTLITNSFGNVNVKGAVNLYGTEGNCAPFMFDVAGSYKLLCGSISGRIFYYDNIDGNLSGSFNRIDTNVNYINDGPRSALQYVDINGDLKRDLIVGNYAGGLSYYSSKNWFIGIKEFENANDETILAYPNPANTYLEIKDLNNFTERTEVILMDVLGKIVLTQSSNSNATSLNCEDLDRGVYLLRVNSYLNKQQRTSYKKIILQ